MVCHILTLVFILALPVLENQCATCGGTTPTHPGSDTGRGQPQCVPPKVRLDGEAELTASLLAQLLLLAVLLAVILALLHVLRGTLLALLDLDLAFLGVREAAAVDFGRRRRRRRRRR